ncbi:hypothetical protein CDD82_6593 [Ophiocordyceps australis]|uniref:Pseudouridine synthase I TruA alpha/beta domain-containing protein n=1 Tax=Ophiocordyceps australis TaxID=1399860 RepID=A0A2C5XG91_9HYPO|nr:hypothetical protein CDD82_6593 [Ophiocordyceps australis]
MSGLDDYEQWTKSSLIARVRHLESQLDESGRLGALADKTRPDKTRPDKTTRREMDASKYSTRFIALKLAYLGKNYGGFEFQPSGNLPSIEEELWKALTRACLIFPNDNKLVKFDCCDYSKCGRTDRGVSAFGQVIALRVRSNRPRLHQGEPLQFDHVDDELCYPRLLNRILPQDIRVLAWCPWLPADFSARFSCRERQYRYFFTQPALAPLPSHSSSVKTEWLDIEAMRDAAKRFQGEHDFRNFCKLDPAKQITNFSRRIFEADIVQVQDDGSTLAYLQDAGFAPPGIPVPDATHLRIFYFHVRGSAFLWHQIRHMVAILFLVGQGLEQPSLVSELLNVQKHAQKPNYVMADYLPLVLWDCVFSGDSHGDDQGPAKDSLDWIYIGDDKLKSKFGKFGLVHDIWALWRQHKMDEVLANQLLRQVSAPRRTRDEPSYQLPSAGATAAGVKVFDGGNRGRYEGRYVAVMDKKLLQTVEEQNDKYAKRKGYANAQDMWTRRAEDRARLDKACAQEE